MRKKLIKFSNVSGIQLKHTNSDDDDFKKLSAFLEAEIMLRDGDMADINYQLNKIDFLEYVLLIYEDNIAVACGAFRKYNYAAEIKRMYVMPSYRKRKLATTILIELENLAKLHGYGYCVLETGKNQPEAISFYTKQGYSRIDKFGKYIDSINSVCFQKQL